jgi:hypothetical protein
MMDERKFLSAQNLVSTIEFVFHKFASSVQMVNR